MLQWLLTAGIVLLCAWMACRRVLPALGGRSVQTSSGCGGCTACGSAKNAGCNSESAAQPIHFKPSTLSKQ